jgi:glucosylceramidase
MIWISRRNMSVGFFLLLLFHTSCIFAQSLSIKQVTTTEKEAWVTTDFRAVPDSKADFTVELLLNRPLQTMDGFGACFNELGWTALSSLSEPDRQHILKELFAPGIGANFNMGRMPVGANDFSRNWYSYNEHEGDFKMQKFSIQNDLETLVPFIKNALKHNPKLSLWASPWSPPAWMKYNKHYACAVSPETLDVKFRNDLTADKQGAEGSNMFVQEKKYFSAYALYFSKFIDAYRKQGIKISMVMPQNEFNSCQNFPSCTWTAKGLATFIGGYLGPEMKKKQVALMFGTMEREDIALVDTIMMDAQAKKYITGIGFQWAGKGAIGKVYQKYPELKLYQTEQECGDGKNDWAYCNYTWDLMKQYLKNGASAYLYWNIALEKGGFSRWGWQQNSLVTVDAQEKTFRFNHEYYLMKHLSHYVSKGAKRIETRSDFDNLLAFVNPDGSVVVIAQNKTNTLQTVHFKLEKRSAEISLPANSFSTIVFK